MKANIYVTLKKEVLDPQGDAVERALHALGFEGVRSVRVGKFIEIDLPEGTSRPKEELEAMCKKLLSNPVIEDFRVELAEDV